MNQPRPKTQAFGGLVLGVIAVALITALLTAAVSSSNADTRTEALASKLERVTNDLTELRDDTDRRQRGTLQARADLQHDNAVLKYQNRVLQQKVLVLIRLLRASDITVPPATLAPQVAPRQTASPNTTPTAKQPGNSGNHRAKPKK